MFGNISNVAIMMRFSSNCPRVSTKCRGECRLDMHCERRNQQASTREPDAGHDSYLRQRERSGA
jgi:hypothetical protein